MTHPLAYRARRLRRDMTDAERLLWSRVRNGQMGSKFRRQVPIGPYIADFLCSSARLVVELDGGQHNACPQDALRDAFFRQNGYEVLRFWNNDVLANIDGVLLTLQSALEERKGQSPPPNLPQQVGEECLLPPHLLGRAGVGKTTAADPLAPLRAQLALSHPACTVRWTPSTGSTNADLLAEARAGRLDGPTLLVTGHQTAGRGRQGRRWADEAQASVLCSLAWADPRKRDPGPLSLAVGVWLAQALHALGAAQVRLKWPNDLLLPDAEGGWRKLGGILVEMADTPQARWAVIGFGLNLRAPPDQPQAAGLDAAGLDLPREAVLAALAPALLGGLQRGPHGVAEALAQWDALHAWNGQAVSVLDHGQTLFSGTALGIGPDGALRVDTPGGERRVLSADVSLRLRAQAAGAAETAKCQR
ncbi:MAG: biotin--[acetyl-CoA-carboxylase] ligase [Thiomonas sp.]|uniref:biotin--[acetyl-CoA-carboxylase] ligase n=1 Tax=Thiomonas sp. TaxID=2047785 RepID=UPI002A360D49|nr:biotin--[acetyl-CoA-carboxylase] ligase [Thiomonas sp.]MDY0330946.1 biotin--[acetyl-CoA-carboxylase] ligase [Thiomonas sp.]